MRVLATPVASNPPPGTLMPCARPRLELRTAKPGFWIGSRPKPVCAKAMLKIRILGLAVGDLEAGRDFYERQQPGWGVYFLDTLFSDIEALLLYAGVHAQVFGYFRAGPNGFLMPSITRSMARTSKSGGCWIAVKIPDELRRLCTGKPWPNAVSFNDHC